jgi:O-antigen ligase/polysaccharide polymerase Wzy-like membrane protein
MKIGSSVAPVPNLTAVFFVLAAAALVVWPDAPGMIALAVVAVVAGTFGAFWLSRSPGPAVAAMIAASAMPRLFIEIGGLKARPEHLVCGLMVLLVPFWLRHRPEPMKWEKFDYILVAYLGMQVFSSLVMSIEPMQTIKWAIQQIIVVMAYFLLRILLVDKASFRRAFDVMLVVGLLGSVYAIVSFYSNLVFGTDFGVQLDQYGSTPATYGAQFEANLLGSTCGSSSAMMLMMFLRTRERKYLLGFSITFTAMAISLSRGALAGSLLALTLVAYRNRSHFDRAKVSRLAWAMLGITIVVAPAIYGIWSERFSTVEITDLSADDTTRDRLVTVALAGEGIAEHPLVGNGTSSYQLQYTDEAFGDPDAPGWIPNTETRILYDTGIVGFGLFIAFCCYLGASVKRLLKKTSNVELEALVLAFVVYCVSFQFTEGTLLAFTWVHLGMIACAVLLFKTPNGTGEQAKLPA